MLKYPISNLGFQCLGPCYNKNVDTVHPITLERVTNHYNDFCHVNPYNINDENIGEIVDKCIKPVHNIDISEDEQSINILTPFMDFNTTQFVKNYYNIDSFDDCLEWVFNNEDKSYTNRIRVLNTSLHAFGKNIEIVDKKFNELFIIYIKNNIINIYEKIHKYIHVNENNKVYLGNQKNNKLEKNDHSIERINYLISTFINENDIYKFVNRYFEKRKDKWITIRNHLDNMLNDLIQNIIKKIEISL
jgi:hypothetical protein